MFVHGFTFGGHPVCAAAALANLDIFEREDLCGHVLEKEGEFRGMLEELRDIPIVGDVRGAGYFHAIELVKDQDTKESFSDEESETLLRGYLSGALYENGPDLPRRRPRRPRDPALAAADRRQRAVRGDRAGAADGAHRGDGPHGAATTPRRHAHAAHARRRGGPRAGLPATRPPTSGALGAHHRAARPHAVAVRAASCCSHGTAARRRPKRQREFVRLLVRPPPRRARDSAPASTTDGARRQASSRRRGELGFPVFEVPYELPFIAITEKAFARLVNDQYEVLQRGIAIHKRLERLVIEERGLDELVRALAAAIGGAVMVLDARGAPLAERAFRRPLSEDAANARGRAACAPAEWRVRRPGDASEFAPDHPDVAGRSLVLAVSSARWRAPAGVAGGRPRRGRPRRLRAPDPAAGSHRGGARADAPARDARHRAPAGRRRAGRGPRRGAAAAARPTTPSCTPGWGRSGWATVPPCWCSRRRRAPGRPPRRTLDRFLADAGLGALVAVRERPAVRGGGLPGRRPRPGGAGRPRARGARRRGGGAACRGEQAGGAHVGASPQLP